MPPFVGYKVEDDEHNDSANDGDEHAVQVKTGHTGMAHSGGSQTGVGALPENIRNLRPPLNAKGVRRLRPLRRTE
jgi:hypothetical protein